MLFDDLTCAMCYRLDLDLNFFTGTAFRQQIFYRNGVPDRSGLLSPLLNRHKSDLALITAVSNSGSRSHYDATMLLQGEERRGGTRWVIC